MLAVDVFSLFLAIGGFVMAFRQHLVRRLMGRRDPLPESKGNDADDPLTYILRIAGVMTMVFGIALGGMMTLFSLLSAD
ncbi:hypothetical protein WBP07_22575 (plasmid) [Novosphingobium sp. BL-8A]|uniref:hypothetical protein n=1 Tax=Novosphingobium sp. BL-8A TaxID=3127639 RepID=UPI0037575B7E